MNTRLIFLFAVVLAALLAGCSEHHTLTVEVGYWVESRCPATQDSNGTWSFAPGPCGENDINIRLPEPVANATVRIGDLEVRTGTDGMARFGSLPPGRYTIFAAFERQGQAYEGEQEVVLDGQDKRVPFVLG